MLRRRDSDRDLGGVARLAAWTPPTTLSNADEANPTRPGRVRRQRPDGLAEADRRAVQAPRPARRRSPPPTRSRRSGPAGSTADGNAIVLTVAPAQAACSASARSSDGTRAHDLRQHPLGHAADARGRPRRHRGRRLGLARPGGLARAGRDPPSRPAALRQAADRLAAGAPAGNGRSCASPRARAAAPSLTWQVQTGATLRCTSLTAGTDSTFGADQVLAGGGRWADVALAVGAVGRRPGRLPRPDERPDQPARRAGHRRRAARRARGRSRPAARAPAPAPRSPPRSPPTAPPPSPGPSPAPLRGGRHARGLHPRARRPAFGAAADARRGRPRASCSPAAPAPPPRWPG